MSASATDFNRGAVRPIVCFREGWQLIKDDYWLFFGIALVGMLIGGAIPFGILLGPMWCGIEICLLRRLYGRRVTFNHLFDGFNYFGPSIVATVTLVVPMVMLILLAYVAFFAGSMALFIAQVPQGGQGGPPDPSVFGMWFGMFALYVAAILFISTLMTAPCIFMYALIVERQLSGFAALGTSIKALLGNFWGVVGLLVLNNLVGLLGSLVFCFGIYLVLPLTFATYAVAYRQVFPPLAPAEDDLPAPEWPPEPVLLAGAPPSTSIQAEPAPSPPTDFVPGPPE